MLLPGGAEIWHQDDGRNSEGTKGHMYVLIIMIIMKLLVLVLLFIKYTNVYIYIYIERERDVYRCMYIYR